MRKRKVDNNLICVEWEGRKYYYTSFSKASAIFDYQTNGLAYACAMNNVLNRKGGKEIRVSIVDGSEIPYKLINNEIEEGE